ncbi:hypothetical protein ASG22_01090 [Chryseobacterium sp. Leaf405]|uniref:hypothetical protein n=1 Tax=Chryseobacterium sp. Leaf405 TaxID=1736367 RepID=UPI0006FC78CF|nr:hypothetical protein [Chryseobacterium sp. Leaf405]KQT35647.1 hypothetical protein ASG22_01090 [Chryseobacterium sp. Leaf405]
MSLNQTISCPVCSSPIAYNVMQLIAGASFECKTCGAVIRIAPSSMNEVKNTYENYMSLKDNSNARKVNTFDINEFIEVVDKV